MGTFFSPIFAKFPQKSTNFPQMVIQKGNYRRSLADSLDLGAARKKLLNTEGRKKVAARLQCSLEAGTSGINASQPTQPSRARSIRSCLDDAPLRFLRPMQPHLQSYSTATVQYPCRNTAFIFQTVVRKVPTTDHDFHHFTCV